MKHTRTASLSPIPHRRGGTTLTEVLMSILCMGIGVVAVASLFPIALLRSVQATQLTSGTILRFNAETLIDLYNENPRNLILNPDFDLASTKPPLDEFQEHFNKNYLIDPLGAMIVRGDEGRPISTTDQVGLLPRYDALRIFYPTPSFTEDEAENIVTLPDSWVTLEGYDEFPPDQTGNPAQATSIVLGTNTKIDLMELSAMVGSGLRIVLFNKNGRLSEVRSLNAASLTTAAGEIHWATPLPNNNEYFPSATPGTDPGAISRIRIEVKERRYTWLLTVRNDTLPTAVDPAVAKARVDVVIFFRRSPAREEEIPYVITGSGRNYTVSKIASADWSRFYPSTPYPDPYPDPFLKKGGFMLDTKTGTWHRLQKVNDFTKGITLERNTRTLEGDHVVFMKGVIDVYPLGSKP